MTLTVVVFVESSPCASFRIRSPWGLSDMSIEVSSPWLNIDIPLPRSSFRVLNCSMISLSVMLGCGHCWSMYMESVFCCSLYLVLKHSLRLVHRVRPHDPRAMSS